MKKKKEEANMPTPGFPVPLISLPSRDGNANGSNIKKREADNDTEKDKDVTIKDYNNDEALYDTSSSEDDEEDPYTGRPGLNPARDPPLMKLDIRKYKSMPGTKGSPTPDGFSPFLMNGKVQGLFQFGQQPSPG